MTPTANADERFWAHVQKGAVDECWPWTGPKSRGYGKFQPNWQTTMQAHRWAYATVRPIPDGLTVDHTCHNRDEACPGGPTCAHRACCNPAHLEAVTQRENGRRSKNSLSTINAAKTHCAKDHEFTPENTYIRPDGARTCRTCLREWNLAFYYRSGRDKRRKRMGSTPRKP